MQTEEEQNTPARRFPLKRVLAAILFVVAIGALVLFLRGPHISNYLKMAILSEVSSATGQQVIARSIYMNLYPISIEARDVKAFSKDGARVFSAERVKAYVGFSDILRRRINITRLVLVKPEVWTDDTQFAEIMTNLKNFKKSSKNGKLIKVSADAINILHANISYHNKASNSVQTIEDLDAEVLFRKQSEIRFSVKRLDALFHSGKKLQASFKGEAAMEGDTIKLKALRVDSNRAELKIKGEYESQQKARFDMLAALPIAALKDLLGLTRPTDGTINLDGTVRLEGDPSNPVLDLKVEGAIYLETLVEFFGPQTEDTIKGYAGFKGTVKGPLRDLRGEGRARFLKGGGGFFGVLVQAAECRVVYTPQRLSFLEGKVKIYNGVADADVWLAMPTINRYGMKIRYDDVDSTPIFKLIGIDGFNLPMGKLRGQLDSDSTEFDPAGWVVYNAVTAGQNAFERVRSLEARYNIIGQAVNITEADARTAASRALFNGTFMLNTKALAFKTSLSTTDIRDLTQPFYAGVRGAAEYSGILTGTSADPHFTARIDGRDISLMSYKVGRMSADVKYDKNLLEVTRATGGAEERSYEASGRVSFPAAKEILQLEEPVYAMNLGMRGGDLGELIRTFGPKNLALEGEVSATLAIGGQGAYPEFSGITNVSDVNIYGRWFSSASAKFYYDRKTLRLTGGELIKDGSLMSFDAALMGKDTYEFKASSSSMPIKYLLAFPLPVDQVVAFNASGSGTFDNPTVTAIARMQEGRVGGIRSPSGVLDLSVRGMEARIRASFNEGDMKLDALASLKDDMPWSAELVSNGGKYDFLAGLFLKDIPEDLMFTFKGKASLVGTKNTLSASVRIKELNATMYGQGINNAEEIYLKYELGKLEFERMRLKSNNLSFGVSGRMTVGSDYDVTIDGHSPLAPFRSLSDKIDDLRGTGDFSVKVNGPWNDPQLHGTLTLTDATFAVQGLNQRITSLNGSCQLDGNRLMLQNLSGKVGGGDVKIAGYANFKGRTIDKAYLDMKIVGVTALMAKGFVVNFDGDLLYRDIGGSRDLTGVVTINRARYTERLEWKSWLLAAKKLQAGDMERSWADDVRLNLRVIGDKTIAIENNIARTQLKLDLRLLGTKGEPLLFGRLETNEGKVFFRNSEFRITNVTADYSNDRSIDPYISVIAETLVKGYHVKLNLEGRLEKFDLILSSDPPLDEVEILSLLTLGKFGDNLRGLEGSIGAAEATSFITGHFQDVVEEKFKDITGIDRVEIDPYVAGSTASVTPRVTVSKELVNDKLYVTYAAPIGSSQEQSVILEFLVNDNVTLQGGRDERGSVGGDVKFRFKFR